MTNFGKIVVITFLAAVAVSALGACAMLRPPQRYTPHENHDKDGNSCGTFNCPRQWLKPCNN